MASVVSQKVRSLLEMIKFSHTIFAFPFALIGVVMAAQANGALPGIGQVFWICMAMIGARSGAMGLNRLLDAHIDGLNPRTADRHIPAGKVSRWEAWLLVLAAYGLLVLSAWMLNPLCFYLSFVALFFLVLYSFAKRFTAYAHVILGLCLGAAPVGAWIALRGDISWSIVMIGLAVLLWVAGFDVFYALQDVEFDREQGLHSIPVKLGEEGSFKLVRGFHIGMIVLLLLAFPGSGLGWIYLLGVAVVAAMLLYEHTLVKPGDLSKMDAAFFTMNGYISVTLFVFVLLDVVIL
ncbi:UbiA-like polyprenyltransferase [Desulfuromonas acetoxidans]|uniref:4-hydroxybenzoate polyprenyltransferase n=1 Tax=Desulfuromonas acetoxidans (strain DSM 684 / 11070) TaxID=281689 RepID=Q1K3W3_DESA6|nr:UbiA-like polyprenyltransferase [Desulfuromonas acetoxidans]EAT17340.1 4-hydroxybenzoate polyprenyltransferase, putative [Desulfuromonas acetoxidans DSM 684]MBF0644277.1 UbiA family prenyltransferase [Desulfuromonas acetoxidans]NVD24853.1 UbiA family prenyltransferase [Desulfuromonas acetoxidans]NVE15154.1 UbiA family prenyltransferase [Desulfuromonas acetoxidans]